MNLNDKNMKYIFHISFVFLTIIGIGQEKIDSLKLKKSLAIEVSPTWIIPSKYVHDGKGIGTQLGFSFNKKKFSFGLGFFYLKWYERSHLVDKLYYNPLNFDPAESTTRPYCVNCKSEGRHRAFGTFFNSEYNYKTKYHTFVVGASFHMGSAYSTYSLLDFNNNTIVDKIAIGNNEDGNYYSFILYETLYIGPKFILSNSSTNLRIYLFVGGIAYYPYFIGINLLLNISK